MNRSALIQPIANEDRIPHDCAVWRDYDPYDGQTPFDPPAGANGQQVSIEYEGGLIILAWAHLACWHQAKRWRFGWPPR